MSGLRNASLWALIWPRLPQWDKWSGSLFTTVKTTLDSRLGKSFTFQPQIAPSSGNLSISNSMATGKMKTMWHFRNHHNSYDTVVGSPAYYDMTLFARISKSNSPPKPLQHNTTPESSSNHVTHIRNSSFKCFQRRHPHIVRVPAKSLINGFNLSAH